jgi:hypothetical protein
MLAQARVEIDAKAEAEKLTNTLGPARGLKVSTCGDLVQVLMAILQFRTGGCVGTRMRLRGRWACDETPLGIPKLPFGGGKIPADPS